MQKLLIVAAVALMGVIADKSSFPDFDAFHADCAMDATYPKSCVSIQASMQTILTAYKNGDPGNGIYEIVESSDLDYIWTNRTTPVAKYVDDILFEFTVTGENECVVKSKSRSQTMSVYDYSTNFCNMWNPLMYSDVFTALNVYHCKYPADEPETVCQKYWAHQNLT